MLEYEIQNLENLGIRQLAIMNIEQQEEITRLNNIINELEKHLLDYLEEWEECKEDNEFVNGRCLMARDVLHDIHELKEGKECV